MTNARQLAVSRSIHRALLRDPEHEAVTRYSVFMVLLAFFSIWHIRLVRISADLFRSLRNDVWELDESEYSESFLSDRKTFFKTVNSKYLIKSLPRRSEHSFFRDDFLHPYHEYMLSNADSLLVRITDFLGAEYPTIGTLCQCTPSHHVIMENVLCDKDDEAREPDKWETYDLKPIDYFYPERDLVPKPIAKEAISSRLYDEFKDKIRITKEQYNELKKTIEGDTKFLKLVNTVDYSLFLVRYPAHLRPLTPSRRKIQWREGAVSTDGKWKYRAVLLDFFWAKHKLQAQAMTGVVHTFNAIGRKGPMSITTTADEYREKFLQMLDGLVELHG
ncbi:hypothetical protein UA08_01783 [Talaromyces atroroseus]|uniref:PIPK domain-containing protein n=1 Tax=Talaromyces atroroseus TaxID=1441469 RepID=A0A1Q5QAM8_TALAT|nr:hypothetical protein UA08_01783 [Talaromyces atroroseus]OKL62985.1 hypothetical protein UA08_01783 [Talaromyces atroroseus]